MRAANRKPVAFSLWQRLGRPGLEHCALLRTAAGWELQGTVLIVHQDLPFRVEYRVGCDSRWRTRVVTIEALAGTNTRSLRLTVDDPQRWRLRSRELADVRGCLDVDLAFTPATNTLPIRRLALAVGQSAEVVAAWVRFPEFTIQPLPQKYTRLGPQRYRYESGNGRFQAELDVDELGLVTRYPPGWERIAAAKGAAEGGT